MMHRLMSAFGGKADITLALRKPGKTQSILGNCFTSSAPALSRLPASYEVDAMSVI